MIVSFLGGGAQGWWAASNSKINQGHSLKGREGREKEGLLPSSPGAVSVSFWEYHVQIRSSLSISGVFCNLSWAHIPHRKCTHRHHTCTGFTCAVPLLQPLGETNSTIGLCSNLSLGVLYSRRPSLSPPKQARHPPGVCSPQQHVLAVCAHTGVHTAVVGYSLNRPLLNPHNIVLSMQMRKSRLREARSLAHGHQDDVRS